MEPELEGLMAAVHGLGPAAQRGYEAYQEQVATVEREAAAFAVRVIEDIDQRWRDGSSAKDEIAFALERWRKVQEAK